MFFNNPIENILAWAALIYFIPSLIAIRSSRFASIFVVNLFLGWTLVGWVAALAWALAPTGAQAPQLSARRWRS